MTEQKMPLYTTELTVEAAQIRHCDEVAKDGFLTVEVWVPLPQTRGFREISFKVPTMFLAKGAPKPGDYFIKLDDAFSWLPRQSFHRDFKRKDPT